MGPAGGDRQSHRRQRRSWIRTGRQEPARWVHAGDGHKRKYDWLPSAADTEYLLSIMDKPVFEPGKFANYIAPPRRGINQQPIDFEYVRTER